jgi:predicted nucleic acid-binding protein
VSKPAKALRAVVIADASPLIALTRVGGLQWLARLFGCVYLTPTVLSEVLPGTQQSGESGIQAALDAGWLEVWQKPIAPLPLNLGDLDAGESESIALALQLRPAESLLLIDERAGRAAATECGLAIIGTAAIIGRAKKNGLIPLAKPVLAKLLACDFRISAKLMMQVLKDVGEA